MYVEIYSNVLMRHVKKNLTKSFQHHDTNVFLDIHIIVPAIHRSFDQHSEVNTSIICGLEMNVYI